MWNGVLVSGLVAACALATVAHAGPSLVVGVDDDSLKWTGDTAQVVAEQQALGVRTVRVTLHWAAHASQVDPLGQLYLRRIGRAVELGDRVILSVYGNAARPPRTERARTEYCSYVVDALARVPGVHDVVIWNEANSAHFWRPQGEAAAAYELLLARCYDMVDAYRPTMNVISSTAPHDDPAGFIRALGAA